MTCSGVALGQSSNGDRIIAVKSRTADVVLKQKRFVPGSSIVVDTLEEAVARARQLRTTSSSSAIVIELQPGIHRLTQPLRLTAGDSGTLERPLIIRSSTHAPAIIRGSQVIVAKPPTPAELARFPVASRPHLNAYEFPVSASLASRIDIARRHDMQPGPVPFEVFDSQGAMHAARWPNAGWATGTSRSETGVTFSADPDRVARWTDEHDVWVSGFLRWNWAYETRPMAVLSGSMGEIALDSAPQYGFAKAFRMAVHHAAAELDIPGEWVRSQDRKRLIAWPRDAMAALEVSVAEQLVVIDGARHVRLEGLTFERVRGEAIVVRDSEDIGIVRCSIRWTGGRAVSIEGGLRNGVSGGLIEDAGEGGVRLVGGDRRLLKPAGHFVRDTVIRRFSRLGQTYRPAIALEGVGNRAEGNAISDGPHMAVFFSGNEHIIALNEIADVVATTSDSGAIYTGRDWTAQGTVIKHNFIHDVRGRDGFEVKGIYLDDFASGITIDGNVFVRVDQPVFIGGGRDNVVSSNVFIASQPAIHIDGRGRTWAADAIANKTSELYKALAAVPTASLAWIERYPRLYTLLSDDPADPKRTLARGNRVLRGEVYRLLDEVKAGQQRLEPAAVTRPEAEFHGQDEAAELLRAVDIEARLRAAYTAQPGPELPFAQMDRAAILAARATATR
jgi:Right handed beta helix region